MIRCTIELLPGGDETRARVIGLVEIANIGGSREIGEYAVSLKKTPPFKGALKAAWKTGKFTVDANGAVVGGPSEDGYEDADIVIARVGNHHRTRRGSYDLLYRALAACGLGARVP
jgi:hypothetical protein